MEMVLWIAVGIAAAVLARLVIQAEKPVSLIADMVASVAGAVLGGLFYRAVGDSGVAAFDFTWGTMVAFGGSVVLLFLVRTFAPHRTSAKA